MKPNRAQETLLYQNGVPHLLEVARLNHSTVLALQPLQRPQSVSKLFV